MSDNPFSLTSVELANASPEAQQEFLKMVREQRDTFELQKSHRCWFWIPSEAEYERMKKYLDNDNRCPKCGKGRVVAEICRGTLDDSVSMVCRWGADKCDLQEYISDDL